MIFIFMILVKIETPGKAFYCQERVGLMGEKKSRLSNYDPCIVMWKRKPEQCGHKKKTHESREWDALCEKHVLTNYHNYFLFSKGI